MRRSCRCSAGRQLHGAAVQPGVAVLRLRAQRGLRGVTVQGGDAKAGRGQAPL